MTTTTIDLSRLSDRERKTYSEGLAIVRRKLAAADLAKRLPAIAETAVERVLKKFTAEPADS